MARCSARAGRSGLTHRTTGTTNGSSRDSKSSIARRRTTPPTRWRAILGVKLAWEKAQDAAGGKRPTNEQVGAALENMTYEGPGGTVKMALGKGHQAIMETAYGTTKLVNGKLTLVNVKRYPAEKVNPPEGMKSADWIKSGFKSQ